MGQHTQVNHPVVLDQDYHAFGVGDGFRGVGHIPSDGVGLAYVPDSVVSGI
jgi:hypothetical protein